MQVDQDAVEGEGNVIRGASVLVGSFITRDDTRMVSISVNAGRAVLSIEGARLIAKQITEWADFAEKHHAAHPWAEPFRKMMWKVITDDDASKAAEPLATPPAKGTRKSTKKRASKVALAS